MTTGRDIAIALRTAYLAFHRRSEAAFAPHAVTADQFVPLATPARDGLALTRRVAGSPELRRVPNTEPTSSPSEKDEL